MLQLLFHSRRSDRRSSRFSGMEVSLWVKRGLGRMRLLRNRLRGVGVFGTRLV